MSDEKQPPWATCATGSSRSVGASGADLWHRGGRSLALADQACLVTALVRGLPVVTVDRAWAAIGLGIEVQVIG